MNKARYLELKEERKELHAEMKRFKKFYMNSLNIPKRWREDIHDRIISNFNSHKREYKLITELLNSQKELRKVTRKYNWIETVTIPF